MGSLLEILPVGSDGRLFQVCDGERFGHIEIEGGTWRWERGRDLIGRSPDVITFIVHWLDEEGVLIGSQNAPCLAWRTIEREVPAARGLLN